MHTTYWFIKWTPEPARYWATMRATTTLSNLTNLCTTWIRDLTEEGIEPNPGPRYVTKNVNGLQGAGKLFQCCKAIASEHERQPITALFIQEHNLKQQDKKTHEKIARGHQLLILPAYATPKQFQATSWGGTAIIIPHSSIEKKPGESLDDAILRIQKSTFRPAHLSGRAISAKMHVLGHPRTLTCAYAPAEPSTELLGTEWTKVGTSKPKEGREPTRRVACHSIQRTCAASELWASWVSACSVGRPCGHGRAARAAAGRREDWKSRPAAFALRRVPLFRRFKNFTFTFVNQNHRKIS